MNSEGRRRKNKLTPFDDFRENSPAGGRKVAAGDWKNARDISNASRESEIRERARLDLNSPYPPRKPKHPPSSRFEALDLARGLAIILMILSHGVKGLMTFEQMPAWGLVPIHLITKFSSSLFLLAFGVALALSFVPHTDTPAWPKKRKKLLIRGLVVFFWYKMLTILEMSHLFGRDEIWSALTYQSFPVYVEILGFYSIALLWIPWVLPFWKSSHAVVRFLLPIGFLGASTLLYNHFDFFGSEPLKAIFVEHPNHYAWGQLSRAPLVFTGLLIGWMIQASGRTKWPRLLPFGVLAATSITLFGLYLSRAGENLSLSLMQIAMNAGKHPPEADFMFFSLGGAFLVLALSVIGARHLAGPLSFVIMIGKNSLKAFVFHIVVLFVFYRFLFDSFHNIEYKYALSLAVLLIALTAVWLKVTQWVKENS